MRVDNLSFFLKVEGIFFSQNTSLPCLIWELLLVIGDCAAGVGIANEAIRASVSFNWRLARMSNYFRVMLFTNKTTYFHLKNRWHKFGTSSEDPQSWKLNKSHNLEHHHCCTVRIWKSNLGIFGAYFLESLFC